ncbi:PHD finger protein 3 [Gastrophryne carolinensis]
MDIVDTFNHLIPTEHLDDALFLGSNLESEACEEFATSQHVEDSLKNMLSDKDPMLGSASTQYCLPVLENTGHNFQIPPTTGVALDDIMDVGVDKVTPVDINEDDDLILPDKNLHSLKEPCIKSQRKSSRLKAQESPRTLRTSTVEKTSNTVKVASPKKMKASRKEPASEKGKDKEHNLNNENDDKGNSTQNSRRSSRISSEEGSSTLQYILSNTQSVLENANNVSETINEESLILLSDNSVNVIDEVTKSELHDSQEDHRTEDVLNVAINDKAFSSENDQTDDKKANIIYDQVHQELALLCGVSECSLGVKTGLHPEINVESVMQKATEGSVKEMPDSDSISTDTLCTNDKSDSAENIPTVEVFVQNLTEDFEDCKILQVSDQQRSDEDENFRKQNRRGVKKNTPSTNRQQSELDISDTTNTIPLKDGSLISESHKGGNKKAKITCIESQVVSDKSKVIKVTRKIPERAKGDSVAVKTTVKNKPHVSAKKSSSTTLLKQLDKSLREDLEDTSQIASSRVHSRSSSHSSDKSATKHSMSKVSHQAKDMGEQKEASDHSDEKTKLKKSLPPRQRRSSKSVSVDEPPLFIPDNIPAVKKEGAEVTSPSDKYVWNPTRHCSFCRKLHGNRFMVGCGRCEDWFHGECVGLSLAQAQQMEVDDKEYICIKCCAEEEKMDISETSLSNTNPKLDVTHDEGMLEIDKQMTTVCLALPHDKSKQTEDALKHKVKISKKNSGENKQTNEKKDLDIKKHSSDRKSQQSPTASRRTSEEKREKSSKEFAPTHDEKTSKSGIGVGEKQELKRKKPERKVSSSGVPSSSPSTPKPSVDQIRQSVRQSLKEILLKRLSESSSKIPEDRAPKVSAKIEKELFSFYRDTDSKYKNKYRSLMFNLKDPKNNVLFKRVLRGDITPEHLIKMTPEELASKELAAWRQRENRHTIEMIEKEQREVERRPITKITHKGEIEIETEAPIKEPEAMDTEESILKTEKEEKKEEKKEEEEQLSDSMSDTTTQHKNHLFDLNCKICTGRMAPPAEDSSPKKVKVAVGAILKQSEEGEVIAETSSVPSITNIDMLEIEKPESPKETMFSPSSSEPFSITESTEDESTFLSRLTYIWKGFLNMNSVAKFIVKAYPVSGSLEHLSEDLPDSIQVGGRISPQTVWDYVEKIRASGTKETCVIRFCPETEEDQISYTLLFSYFNSRKRYGVVANNMRQVKDMYLIPLGASEKIPHFFVPFDGPGLETRRPNLLLALIIRQKVKRQHSVSLDEDNLGTILSVPEKKSKVGVEEDEDEDDDENDFFNSFSAVLHKNRNRSQQSETDESQPSVEPVPEVAKQEPTKPLRFLPGVLVGWENPQSAIDLASKPLPVDDILQSLLETTENTFEHRSVSVSGDQTVKVDNIQVNDGSITAKTCIENDTELTVTTSTVGDRKENSAPVALSQSAIASLSLKDKPPDVSTEVYLARINAQSNETAEEVHVTEPADSKFSTDMSDFSPVPENKNSTDESSTSSVSINAKSSKLIHIKRDPRQAAGRSRHISSSESKDYDTGKNEGDRKTTDTSMKHKKDKSKKHSQEESEPSIPRSDGSKSSLLFSSTKNKSEIGDSPRFENTKSYPPDLLIDETDPLQQFRRALAANKSQSSNSSEAESPVKNASPVFTGTFSPLRLQQPSFLPLKNTPPPFPFQPNPAFALQGNPIFPYPPHIPPLLPTPLGIGFPRPPRFPESSIHNPLVPWHPTLQIPQQPHFFGHVPSGPILNSEQVLYQAPQKLYSKDHSVQERRHSDPWEKQDRDRSFGRGSRSDHRHRFYSESHHSRDKRQEKESGSDKHSDKDSIRSRRRDREKERSRDGDRKSRDEAHREKERSRVSHSDKSSDSKTSKERKNEKSKNEERGHDKEKSRARNRDREEDKERDRHHRDKSRDRSDKSKSKR